MAQLENINKICCSYHRAFWYLFPGKYDHHIQEAVSPKPRLAEFIGKLGFAPCLARTLMPNLLNGGGRVKGKLGSGKAIAFSPPLPPCHDFRKDVGGGVPKWADLCCNILMVIIYIKYIKDLNILFKCMKGVRSSYMKFKTNGNSKLLVECLRRPSLI